jgi:signal transduction histidine kinase
VIREGLFHLADIANNPGATAEQIEYARLAGYRTRLMVPMRRGADVLGVIAVTREDASPFPDQQVELLKTFADQAVIAIENVRLFTELQDKNKALTQAHAQVSEALEQQTATSDILRVISSSPTDVQPVFDAIVRSASRLCGGEYAIVTRYDGRLLQLAAQYNPRPGTADETVRFFPVAPRREASLTPRAFVDARVVHVPDVDVAEDLEASTREFYRRIGLRAALAMPMIQEGRPIGVVSVSRGSPGPFSDRQIALLQTFADQAVIAIENVRLFKELQTSNRDLTTALDQQTATSEVLRAITHAPTDTQPVFDTIVRNAVRLCNGFFGIVTRYDGHTINIVAKHNLSAEALELVRKAHARPGSMTAQALTSRAVVHVHDAMSAAELSAAVAKSAGYRTIISVPMLREGQPIGTINVSRRELRPFSDTEIDLLKTFADQAVIAIENVRLFTELQARTGELTRSVDELTALGEVSRALSATLDVDVVLDTIVTRANDLIGADGCTIFEYDEATEQFHLRATRNLEPGLVELARGTPLRRGDQGILGRLPSERQAIQVPDITVGSYSSPISDALIEAGYRAVVAVPLVREDHLIGALTMNRKTPGEFPLHTIQLLQTFATQSALAIQNARLFREIADKSRQLEVASQHKSEFLANMSHELRTPLNAIIGFSEVLSDRMFGELNEKQEEYLKDIHASGQHLLSLINDILDLSKIEAGKMELELSDFDLPMTIDNALMLVRERAARKGIELHRTVDERLGQIQADERKVRQVVLNLLSNAIKFTPEGGRIEVRAKPMDGSIEVSVTDTGVGIAPEDQDAVFEEFRQVGTAEKKVEGTGLGLALSRKFIELHGGKIWVKSQVGAGSTFTFTVPVRRGE